MRYFEGYTIAKFDDGTTGNVIAAASVEVRKVSDNSLATLYSTDNTGGATLSNPLTTDSNGKYAFYAVNDRYKITASKSGVSIVDASLDDVLFFDVVDGGAAIKTAYEAEADTNAFTDAEKTKLSGIETGADATDTDNVTAAGALMDSELANIAAVKAINQGLATTDNVTFSDGQFNGNVAINSTSNTTDTLTIENNNATTATLLRVSSNNGSASHDGNMIEIVNDFFAGGTSDLMYLQQDDNGDGMVINMARGGTGIVVNATSGPAASFDGDVLPGTDNSHTLGNASFRMSELFSANGTINTSDETQKTKITALTGTEKAAYLAVKNIIGSYKWLDAVDKKGESARVHVGVGAQSAIAEFTSRGLDWQKYACFCLDDISVYETKTVTESQQVTVTKTREVASIEVIDGVPTQGTKPEEYNEPQFNVVGVVDESGEKVINEDGEQLTYNIPIMEDAKVKKQVLVPAGQRYGIRYNELIMGILASI